MPKICQPTRLERLALESSCQWLCKVGEELMPIISGRQETYPICQTLKNRIKLLQELFEYNVPYVLFDSLSDIIFSVIPNFIEQMKTQIGFSTTGMAKFLGQVNVAVSLTEVLISPKLKKINFETMPKIMRHLFYSKLGYLTGLRYLNLGSMSGGWKTEDMEPLIIAGVSEMKNLQVFILNYDGTDNILLALVTTCPNLILIDLTSSKSITNESIDILINFKHLRSVQLYRTSVTQEGYIRLLMHLPSLEDIGRYDELGRCLEFIDDKYPEKTDFKLTKFISRCVTTKHLQLLSEKCPEISIVSIFHNTLINDLMTLIAFNNLTDLKLMSCDFFGDQVRDVLQVKGCNLTHLHLEHVDEIDMNALMYISQYCPDLKSLTMYNCDLIESTSLYTQKLPIPPFMNLEQLTICSTCYPSHIEFMLSTAYKLKSIHFGTFVPINDYTFQRILARHPLEHLEELKIVASGTLTIATAYKLVESCQNLAMLNELESWSEIKPSELDTFKMFVKMKNYDLDMTPLRKFE